MLKRIGKILGICILTVVVSTLTSLIVVNRAMDARGDALASSFAPPSTSAPANDNVVEQVPDAPVGNYRCTSGHTAVHVPLGETVQADGATYRLDERRGDAGVYQERVVVSITLPQSVSVPTIIVHTSANYNAPALYAQYPLPVAIESGGTAEHILPTDTYSQNYEREGIVGVTACTKAS